MEPRNSRDGQTILTRILHRFHFVPSHIIIFEDFFRPTILSLHPTGCYLNNLSRNIRSPSTVESQRGLFAGDQGRWIADDSRILRGLLERMHLHLPHRDIERYGGLRFSLSRNYLKINVARTSSRVEIEYNALSCVAALDEIPTHWRDAC